tara:strand:- start:273 stop:422 length:150 start_codon:yes stop_codon:yes gene_type:complete
VEAIPREVFSSWSLEKDLFSDNMLAKNTDIHKTPGINTLMLPALISKEN